VEYKQLIESSDGYLWEECCAEEIGRLAQGYKCVSGTDTIHFIKVQDIPSGRKPTYLRLVVADKPNKENPRRVRFTAGGDQIQYPGEVSTKTSGMTTAKIFLNSVLSTPGARFCAFDIKDFYLRWVETAMIPEVLVQEEVKVVEPTTDSVARAMMDVAPRTRRSPLSWK
jgi:hypothetical protein